MHGLCGSSFRSCFDASSSYVTQEDTAGKEVYWGYAFRVVPELPHSEPSGFMGQESKHHKRPSVFFAGLRLLRSAVVVLADAGDTIEIK